MNKGRNEKKNIWKITIEGLHWKQTKLYKKNKNEIKNQKNEDWNWKIKNK
jgi:hypothetical protein